jgi:isochorismate hydrolase
VTGGSEIPAGSVVITPQDMWDAIARIETKVTDVQTTLAPAVKDIRDDHDDLRAVVEDLKKDHEDRIRALERANWKLVGVYTAITVIATIGEAFYYTTHH